MLHPSQSSATITPFINLSSTSIFLARVNAVCLCFYPGADVSSGAMATLGMQRKGTEMIGKALRTAKMAGNSRLAGQLSCSVKPCMYVLHQPHV